MKWLLVDVLAGDRGGGAARRAPRHELRRVPLDVVDQRDRGAVTAGAVVTMTASVAEGRIPVSRIDLRIEVFELPIAADGSVPDPRDFHLWTSSGSGVRDLRTSVPARRACDEVLCK